MKSFRELYRIGLGPSISHTMGQRFSAQSFKEVVPPAATHMRITLFGSLAATGRGHMTEFAVSEPFSPMPVELVWLPEELIPRHPNGLKFEVLDETGRVLSFRIVYSVGGGSCLMKRACQMVGAKCIPCLDAGDSGANRA